MKNYMDAVRAAGIGRTPQLCQDALIETLEELFAGSPTIWIRWSSCKAWVT